MHSNLGIQVIEGFLPVNLATAANAGDWIKLTNFQRALVLFFKGPGAAGEDPVLTLEQATSAAGAGAKALNFDTIFVKQAATNLQATGDFTKIAQSPGNTYTEATSGESAAIWVVQVSSQMLDRNGGFNWFRASVADVGATSQLGSLLYLGLDPRRDSGLPESMIA